VSAASVPLSKKASLIATSQEMASTPSQGI
jgi:hypothetical protein